MTRAAVFGAGSWGTAFAQILADAGAERVTLWARRAEVADHIRDRHRNPDYLSEVELPPVVTATTDPAEAADERARLTRRSRQARGGRRRR